MKKPKPEPGKRIIMVSNMTEELGVGLTGCHQGVDNID